MRKDQQLLCDVMKVVIEGGVGELTQPRLEGSAMLRCTVSQKVMSQQSRGSGRRTNNPNACS